MFDAHYSISTLRCSQDFTGTLRPQPRLHVLISRVRSASSSEGHLPQGSPTNSHAGVVHVELWHFANPFHSRPGSPARCRFCCRSTVWETTGRLSSRHACRSRRQPYCIAVTWHAIYVLYHVMSCHVRLCWVIALQTLTTITNAPVKKSRAARFARGCRHGLEVIMARFW